MDATGRFEAKLDFQKEYILRFSQTGYFSKLISISTVVPADRIKDAFHPNEINVSLLEEVPGVNADFLKDPAKYLSAK